MVMTRVTYKTVLNAGMRMGLSSIMDLDEGIMFLNTALANLSQEALSGTIMIVGQRGYFIHSGT